MRVLSEYVLERMLKRLGYFFLGLGKAALHELIRAILIYLRSCLKINREVEKK
jgi:hypothetical protein